MNRRTFLTASAAVATAAHPILGANDRINMAVVGVRSRGRSHIAAHGTLPGSRVAAICDIDQAVAEQAVPFTEKVQGAKPRTYMDIRKLLEDKEIDGISIATCNHWHALATIWACQAGKDVYCEKPSSHNIFEGRRQVDAARKYQRIVQVGTQSRSMPHKIRAVELLHQGVIGKLYMAKGLCYKRRLSIGHEEASAVPPGVNFDMWLGPAEMRPFFKNRFHYNWHWYWDTGNGDIGNQGIHEMDIARWGLGKTGHPLSADSSGGKFVYNDDQQTANTQLATLDYGDAQIIFEVRGLPTGSEGGMDIVQGPNYIGNIFFGSNGYLTVDDNGFQVFLGDKREPGESMKHGKSDEPDTKAHIANFQRAMKSRNVKDQAADILEGHISASMVHMANTSYRLGRRLKFDGTNEQYLNDAEANTYVSRNYRAPYVVPAVV